ncbi:MAG TPA: alpha-E domain-containing protein [Candidatus Limnocylindria bacterium]|nr:alpha-E domain-containing protein [Candidatus Limnocylindria bacterium]
MLCRVAEDLFWMARYLERAVQVSRLIEVTRHLELDATDVDFWTPLVGEGAALAVDVRYWLTSDEANPDSLVSCVRHARDLARGVRESLSSEMWEEMNQLSFSLQRPTSTREVRGDLGFHRLVRERLQHVQGLADATLAHDEPWHFITLGQYLERAHQVARVLRRQSYLLERQDGSEVDMVRWLAVLRSTGCAEAYARYYALRVEPARIVEFLLLNPVFPQTVRFSLARADASLREIAALREAAGNDAGPAPRTLGRVRALVENTAVDEIFDAGFEAFLDEVQRALTTASDEITATYLRDQPQAGRLVGVARAAMLMAAQQQQQQQ